MTLKIKYMYTYVHPHVYLTWWIGLTRILFFQTANVLSFILFHLAKNPNVQKTLYEEINQRCKNNHMDESTFANMPYLKACIKESPRFVTDRGFLICFGFSRWGWVFCCYTSHLRIFGLYGEKTIPVKG